MLLLIELKRLRKGRYKLIKFILYTTKSNNTPALDYIQSLEKANRAKVLNSLDRFNKYGFDVMDTKHLKDGIYEFRIGAARLLYFNDDQGNVVITHGFTKKSNKTPLNERRKAFEIRDKYLKNK